MKTFKRIYCYTMALALSLFVVSCTDDNDWSTDSSHDRLFSVANDALDVTEGDTWAEVEFEGYRGTEYYIIEVSTDSLTDEIGMGESEGSIVFGEDRSITTSPDTIRGLTGETKYYLRIKAMSSQTAESNWVYFDNGDGGTSFTTLAEQIFNDVPATDRGDTYMRLTWSPAGTDVTRLTVSTPDGTIVQDIDLTADPDAVANGEYRVENLTPSTTYVFEIFNGDKRRGSLTLATMAAMPDAEYRYYMPATVTVLSQELIDQIAEEAKAAAADPNNYSVTIGITAGTTIDVHGTDEETGNETSVAIPEGMSVTFFGLAGGDAPILNMVKSLDISGSHSYIRFENVQLVDGGCQYFINQSDATTIGGDLSFTDCTMKDFERSLIRLQSNSIKTINEVNIDNCVATNMSHGNGYSVLYWNDAAYTVNTVNITNSTFNTFARSYIEVTGSNTGTINISDCTFYNGPASGRYFIDGNNCPNLNVNLTRCIFALSPDPSNCRGIRGTSSLSITEVYFTSDFVLSSNAFEPTVQLSDNSSTVFVDPVNGDFTIDVRNVEAGDPRWLN